jgi:peptidyl-prolyl isomerase E (cyclophilin E)
MIVYSHFFSISAILHEFMLQSPPLLGLIVFSRRISVSFCKFRGLSIWSDFAVTGGLEENVTEGVLHAAFIPFGDIKDVSMPLDQSTQKHRGFSFVTYLDKEDAAAAMDNMHNAELYGRVLTVNYAQPIKIKGGEQGWASQPVWADADTWFERQQQEEGLQRLQAEHQATIEAAEAEDRKKLTEARDGETEAVDDEPTDPMAQAEAEALSINPPQGS